jgi:ABC-2 type transport system permease protein
MISRGRLAAIARKETLHVLRDWRSLGLAIAIPMLLILLFGYALDLDVDDVPTVVWDQSRTPQSRELLAVFNGSPYFSLGGHCDDYRGLQRELDSGRAMIALVIPSDFAAAINAGSPVSIQVLVDGSDANTGRLALGYATALGMIYNQQLTVRYAEQAGLGRLPAPVEVAARAWYNPELRSTNATVPGVIAIVMMVIAALLTSVTVAKEWELGTMEQLISTPLRVPELILGKLAPYLAIGFLDVLLAVAMAQWVFAVPLRGNPGLLFGMAVVFLVGALCMGLTIGIAVKQQVLAIQIALLATFLPALLLSGFMFAIRNMPQAIQLITYLVPARYFILLLRGIYLKGIGLEVMWLSALVLIVWALLVMAVAHRRLRLRLE